MQKVFCIVLAMIIILSHTYTYGMNTNREVGYLTHLHESVVNLASYCDPHEKNILMKVCKDFYVCLKKNKERILQLNPMTLSYIYKIRGLFKYSVKGKDKVVSCLLNAGINPNFQGLINMTPLWAAAQEGHSNVVQVLLEAKADTTLATTTGDTPLHVATFYNKVDVVKLLIAAGADINLANKSQITPLYFASKCGYIEIVKLFIAANVDVCLAVRKGDTPLHMATFCCQVGVVKLLLAAGANMHAVNQVGWTPFEIAKKNNNSVILKLFQNKQNQMIKRSQSRKKDIFLESPVMPTARITC